MKLMVRFKRVIRRSHKPFISHTLENELTLFWPSKFRPQLKTRSQKHDSSQTMRIGFSYSVVKCLRLCEELIALWSLMRIDVEQIRH